MAEVEVGIKNDKGKPRWSLLPAGSVEGVVAVLEFGAKHYKPNNWKHLLDPEDRCYDAAMRHIAAWRGGQKIDPESGLHHLSHAATNLFFLFWFDVTAAGKGGLK